MQMMSAFGDDTEKSLASLLGRAISAILVFGALATSTVSAADLIPDSPSEPIRIGWIGPLTGNSAVLGVDAAEAIKLAVAQQNSIGGVKGRKVELLLQDDKYDTKTFLSSYEWLLAHKVTAIFTVTYGGFFAVASRAQRDGVLVINTLDCNEDIAAAPENMLCIATLTESIAQAFVSHIKANGELPSAVIYDEMNPFNVVVNRVLQSSFPEDFRSIAVDLSSIDLRPTLLNLRAAKLKSLILLGHDPMGQAMRDARGLGIDAKFYTVGTITSPGFQKLAGDSANGALVAFWSANRTDRFENVEAEFVKQAGRKPILELTAYPAYDAAQILLQALTNSISGTDLPKAQKTREALIALKHFNGLSGEISVDSDGATRSIRESLYEFTNGSLRPLEAGEPSR